MSFEIIVRVDPLKDGTYSVLIHTGGKPAVAETQDMCEKLIGVLKTLRPLLESEFRELHRIPIPHNKSLTSTTRF